MKKLILALCLLAGPVWAQGSGTIPNKTIPVSRGPSTAGWGYLTPGADNTCIIASGGSWIVAPCPGAAGSGVSSINSQVGALTTGAGLTNVGTVFSNSGVLSLGAATGTLTLGSGLTIPGNVLTNTGVLSLGGMTGAITCGTNITCSAGSVSVPAQSYLAPWTNAVSYTQSKLNQNVVYMTDFMGATTCDGTTDQAVNMQRFLDAISAAGATSVNGTVTGQFAPGNCYVTATPTLTINSNANLPVNYYLRGYGTVITPNPASVLTGLNIVRGTFLTRGDESRTTTIEGLTINGRNNANLSWGFQVNEGRTTLLRNNCYFGDDGTTHNQGNLACIRYTQGVATDPDTGPFYGRVIGNTMKGTGIGVSRMPVGIRIDGSAGNAMVISENTIAQAAYGIRLVNPCSTVNANCAYLPNGIVIEKNSIESVAGTCVEAITTVPTLSHLAGIVISQNRFEACTNSAVDISTITVQSTFPSAVLANTNIGSGAYITNPNAIQLILSPNKQWP